jgi:hypothetical protein
VHATQSPIPGTMERVVKVKPHAAMRQDCRPESFLESK